MSFIASSQPPPYFIFMFKGIKKMIIWVFFQIFGILEISGKVTCLYKHPNMDINEFNDDYLNEFLDKLSKEKKNFSFLVSLALAN